MERKDKLKFSDRLLLIISSFAIIFLLCFLIFVMKDLNDVWSTINDSAQIIKLQEDKIRDLQLLVIKMMEKGASI